MAILFVLEFHDPEAGPVQHLYRQRLSRECVAGPFLLMLGEVGRREREVCVDTQVHRPPSTVQQVVAAADPRRLGTELVPKRSTALASTRWFTGLLSCYHDHVLCYVVAAQW